MIHVKKKAFHQILIQGVFKVAMLKVILSLCDTMPLYTWQKSEHCMKKSISAPVKLAFILMFLK